MSDEPAAGKSDIDFDELDKAVNSLMGKVGDETLEDSEKTKILDINTTLKADEKPHYDTLGKAAESIGDETLVTDSEVELVEDLSKLPDEMQLPVNQEPKTETPAPEAVKPAAPAVKRPSSGRFMDMVHPNADMKTAAPHANLAVPSRGSTSVVAAVSPPEVKTVEAAVPDAPLTPFLADAKVEKRPLGGSVPAAEPDAADKSLDDEKDEPVETGSINSENENADDGSGDEQRALNAGDFEKQTATEEELTKIEATEASAEEQQTIEKVESGDTEHLKNPHKPSYEEKVEKEKAPEGAIYDTKNYHQPINHPPKQKSGWGTVLIIIVIIILAVAIAGGAYLYFGLGV